MGMLVNGSWTTDDAPSGMHDRQGAFVRSESVFRDFVTRDGSSGYPAEPGRYHLFLSHGCPWAHRTQIARRLKGLEDVISASFANVNRDEEGWWYTEGLDDLQPVDGKLHLHRVYSTGDPRCTGRVTTPTLWDRKAHKVVNNESSEILRMLNSAFAEWGHAEPDLYPEPLRAEIDAVNEVVFHGINNGVYRCGFAKSQSAYEDAFHAVFSALDEVEARLERHRYLAGDRLTEADVRIFPTLVRFDPVYYSHFKCNLRRIADYPNLGNYLRDLYQTPGFGETVDVEQYKRGYYGNSPRLNPSGIIPQGPELGYDAAHDRATRRYAG